jgi:hypothetical protein
LNLDSVSILLLYATSLFLQPDSPGILLPLTVSAGKRRFPLHVDQTSQVGHLIDLISSICRFSHSVSIVTITFFICLVMLDAESLWIQHRTKPLQPHRALADYELLPHAIVDVIVGRLVGGIGEKMWSTPSTRTPRCPTRRRQRASRQKLGRACKT